MKNLTKQRFIPFLKNISKILDKKNINHEIPYCHIDKLNFNHIFIIIPDYVTQFDISKYFNCIEIKEKNGIIESNIDNFYVFFVKTNDKDWNYTIYYYSWNIIHILVDILFSKTFNLRYTKLGLKYEYKSKLLNITKNIKDIFDFLELKFNMIINGFPTDFVIFEFIESSPFYDTKYFTMDNFKKYDPYFKFNKQYYENFIKHKPERSGDKKTKDEQIIYIDACFPKSKFLENLSRIQLKEEFPNLEKMPIIIKPEKKSIEKKERKKINLKKLVNNKNDKDFNFNIE